MRWRQRGGCEVRNFCRRLGPNGRGWDGAAGADRGDDMTQQRDTKGRFLPRVIAIPDEHDPEYSTPVSAAYVAGPSLWRKIMWWFGK